MSNSYTKASFELTVTQAEADLLREIADVTEKLAWHEPEKGDLTAIHAARSDAFRAMFPSRGTGPFESFLELFDNPNHPALDFDLEFSEPDAEGVVQVYIFGEQFSPEIAAGVIQRVCFSALPCGFDYAFDHDKLRVGEFGGGYAVVATDKVIYGGTSMMIDRALARLAHEGADGFVLSMQSSEQGLSFWNEAKGFGRLLDATVFSKHDAAEFDVPIAECQPEWLAMPAPLRR